MSDEQKAKISSSKKGMQSWNKGMKGIYSTSRKGKTGIYSKESIEKMRQAKLGTVSGNKGKKMSLEARNKISESKRKSLKDKNPNYVPFSYDDRKKRRRERIKIYGGFHSNGEWETLKAQYNWTCPSCGKQEPEIILTRDHIIAISIGGSDNIENIQPLCKSCNSRKSTKTIRY